MINKILLILILTLTSTAAIAEDLLKNKAKKKFDNKIGELSLKTKNKIGIAA